MSKKEVFEEKKKAPKEPLISVSEYLISKRTNPLHVKGKIAYANQVSEKKYMTLKEWEELFKKY